MARLREVPGRKPGRPQLPPPPRIGEAFVRLSREKALHTLVRGAIKSATLKRLLKHALPPSQARELPEEVWASLAVGIGVESPEFGLLLAETLHDRLAWDREPVALDDWWEPVRERPLEALWMAALSESKAVRKEFGHIAEHCVRNYRASPECPPPSWEFVEAMLGLHAETFRELRAAIKSSEDAERKLSSERERLEELREELKRLRRENSELRGHKAQAERRAESLAAQAQQQAGSDEARRQEELERRLRRAEKQREHLERELERVRAADAETPVPASPKLPPVVAAVVAPVAAPQPTPWEDPNPRRRVLRQILKKLVKKGKIGASHTHEDNVYRGVADHEKGLAKEAIERLYLEGLLVPKPTLTDPHVSVSPERTGEVHSIITGDVQNTRLRRWIEEGR